MFTKIRSQIAEGLKAFLLPGAGTQGWPESPSWAAANWLDKLLPSASMDYRKLAGDLWRNSAVAAVLDWQQRTLTEARAEVRRVTTADGQEEAVPDHVLLKLLRRPNDFYNGDTLLQATLLSWDLDGNAYWVKRRGMGGHGSPMELWWVPHWLIEPRGDPAGKDFIAFYRYEEDGRQYRIPREDVVHFRNGLDPNNPRKGLAAMQSLLREVATDNEAATYTAAIMRNVGVVPIMLSPADAATEVTKEARANLLQLWVERTTGENRGKPLLPSTPLRVDKLGLSPTELDLGNMRQVPEDRICAALGISPMVVGLTSGAAHKTFANYQEARRNAWETKILPVLKQFGSTVDHALLPELGDADRERVSWDLSDVRSMREDQDAMAKRVTLLYQGGVWTRAEAREATGMSAEAGDEVYFTGPQGEANVQVAQEQDDGH